MKVTIKRLDGEKSSMDVEPSQTVGSMKQLFSEKMNISKQQLNLVHKGAPMLDAKTLKESNVSDGDIIHIILQINGGASSTSSTSSSMSLSSSEKEKEKDMKNDVKIKMKMIACDDEDEDQDENEDNDIHVSYTFNGMNFGITIAVDDYETCTGKQLYQDVANNLFATKAKGFSLNPGTSGFILKRGMWSEEIIPNDDNTKIMDKKITSVFVEPK